MKIEERNSSILQKKIIKLQMEKQKEELNEEKLQKQSENKNEMAISISTYLSIIILSINRLYAPIKRHRVAEWITKQDTSICCLQATSEKVRKE